MKYLALLPALLVLAGCMPSRNFPYATLIDQRTFQRAGTVPEASALKNLPDRPLATIRFDDPDASIDPEIARAVELALSRKPDAEFNVIIPVGRGKVPGEQAERDATTVARSIAMPSVQPDHIFIGVSEDAGNPPREVLVYVR